MADLLVIVIIIAAIITTTSIIVASSTINRVEGQFGITATLACLPSSWGIIVIADMDFAAFMVAIAAIRKAYYLP